MVNDSSPQPSPGCTHVLMCPLPKSDLCLCDPGTEIWPDPAFDSSHRILIFNS